MSTDSRNSFTPSPSQGDYWGGYMATYRLYAILAAFPITGLLGMDQLALRSPTTAVLKFLVNVLFCGAWYFYDILQIADEKELVLSEKYGFSTPFGPSGHGYRMLNGLAEDKTNEMGPSPYYGGTLKTVMFVISGVLLWIIGFTGIPALILGDTNGAFATFLTSFLMPLYMAQSIYQFFKLDTIEKDGVMRFWPLHKFFYIMPNHPVLNILGNTLPSKHGTPNDPDNEQKKTEFEVQEETYKILQTYINTDGVINDTLEKYVPKKFKSVPKPATSPDGKPLPATKPAQKTTWQWLYDTAKNNPYLQFVNLMQSSSEIMKSASDGFKSYFNNLSKTAVPKLQVPSVPNPVAAVTSAVANPGAAVTSAVANQGAAVTSAVANPVAGVAKVAADTVSKSTQMGGGVEMTGSSDLDYILLMGIGVLAVGGFAAAFYHKFIPSEKKEENESPPKDDTRDDAPPVPGRV